MNRKLFFDAVRRAPFPSSISQSQVLGIAAILDAVNKANVWPDPCHMAYALATAFHESAKTMQPVEEYGKGRGHAYGVPCGPWHQVYDGRGLVQLTWQRNYQFATTRLRQLAVLGLDQDLVKNPELALRPDIAAAVLIYGMSEGWFTGKTLSDYIDSSKGQIDYINARRIINGTDRAAMIAGYARDFEKAIRAAA
jgi:putative chitinase